MKNSNRNIIAAIDIGTNSFHLIIVEVQKNGSFKVLDKERIVLRLGSELGEVLSIISENEIAKAIDVLDNFSRLAKYHNAVIRAVATSAVREAENRNEFIQKVLEKTSINIEVIDGKKEADLIFTGIKKALPIENKKVLCIDIGGGSTEFIYSEKGKVIFAESIKIGAVRLSKMFFPDFIITDEAILSCKDYVSKQITSNNNLNFKINIDFAVGVSGTVDSIFFITQFQKYGKVVDKMNGYAYSRNEFEVIYDLIMKLKTSEERIAVPGMEAKRADIIPAGLIILKTIFEIFNIKELRISEFALREGIVIDTYKKLSDINR
jgi:exopolyphosphatase/guanosine-5'-triphosphate,3'-diphosphate pyrophosphatase